MSQIGQTPLASRFAFSLLAFRGSSESCSSTLHDPSSLAGTDESAMNFEGMGVYYSRSLMFSGTILQSGR